MKSSLRIAVLFCLQFASIAQPVRTQPLHGHVPAAVSHLAAVGRLEANRELKLAIGLPLRDPEGLTNLLQRIYDPASPDFHHFLTPAQFAERFGPTEEDYRAVAAFANSNGLKVTGTHSNRSLLDVTGRVSNIEKAFHVILRTYPHPREKRTFYAPDVEPSLDLAAPVLHVSGLDNYLRPRPMSVKKTPLALSDGFAIGSGSGPNGTYMGDDFRAAYATGVALTGAGQNIGLLEFDGYFPGDISAYARTAGVPTVPVKNIYLDGFDGTPGINNVEVALDIDMVVCMAPGLSSVIVYEGELADDILNRMATDDLANQLSASWTYPIDAATDQIFQQFAAQGQSFFNASGDSDAWIGEIATPCDDPNLTSVGGTTLTTTGPGGAWVSETVWNWDVEYGPASDGQGSGGGSSASYAIPSWQTGVSMAANQGSTIFRNIPDVALTADNIFVIADDGEEQDIGGTSCAVQLWAAFVALANEQAAANGRPALGFINPAIYALGLSVDYTNGFHDITTGNSTWSESPAFFQAVQGYDLCTGWGTPLGSNLINLLALDSLQISPSGGGSFSGAAGGSFTPAFQSYSLANGGNRNLNWTAAATVPWLNVLPNGGTLPSGGAAVTVVVGLNAAASNLFPAMYGATIWFTNLTDGAVQSRAVSLAIIKPPVILTQPAGLTAIGGMTVTFSAGAAGGLPLHGQWQFEGVNMSDDGRVSGSEREVIDPGDIYGSAVSTLTISNLAGSDAGNYTFVASNAAGMTVSSNAILTVTPSGPVIVRQPASQAVLVGATAQFTGEADGTPPFSYQWQQNGTNLKDGSSVSGSLTPTLTLTGASSASIGIYTVIISNAIGTATSTGAVLTVEVAGPGGLVSADGPPIIAIQPANQVALQGSGVTFSVLSAGEFPLLYQWQFDGANIDGATNATLTLADLATNQAGGYDVLVSNLLGSTTSSNGLLTVLSGSQEIVTFDDLPYRLLPVPAGYNNLAWSNFYYLNGVASRQSGYTAGMVSIPKVAFNGNGAPAVMSASAPFVLYSAYLTSAWNDNLQVEAQGYSGAILSYDNIYTLSATTPTLIAFNYIGVTSVRFITSGGTPHHGYVGGGSEFVIDNVSVYAQPIAPPPPSPPLTVLYTFDGFDGGYPSSALVEGTDGNLYGTTEYGGTNGDGTVFKMTTNGILTTLLSFGASNINPEGSLLLGFDGNFYGTTEFGGTNDSGTVFSMTTNGTLSTLASFNSAVTGGYPSAGLAQGEDGNFYGTTPSGGANGLGTVFRVTTNGTLSTLIFFDNTNGAVPYAGLARGADGNFYGDTFSGGTHNLGTVFKMTPDGILTTLSSFNNSDGANPDAALVQGADGNFYGTTEYGGTNDTGTVFSVTTNGAIATLASFNYDLTGGDPTAALVQGPDGSFYGTTTEGGIFGTTYFNGTFGSGTVFNVTTNGTLTTLLSFQSTNGLYPQAGLVMGADGSLYGATAFGGVGYDGFYNSGDGVIFRLGMPIATAPPAIITQPVSQMAPVNGAATFFVNAGGAAPLSYSWQRNGIPIAGATLAAYTASHIQLTDSGGVFSCVISNAFGSITSAMAALTTFDGSGPVYSFHGPDGAWSSSALVEGADGTFYGTTEYGGTNGNGTVFSVTANGELSTLVSFDFYVTGANPFSALEQGADGNFYGTTTFGGAHGVGTVFRLTTSGALTTLVFFDGANGAEPYGALAQGDDGNFYGTTYYSGTYGAGTVFKMTTNGTLTTLISFSGVNGAEPYGALVQGDDGSFFGTTYYGGTYGRGTVFRMTTNGAFTLLFSFGETNGAYPEGGLVEGVDGNFYGTTAEGGTNGEGTVFSLTSNGTVRSLFSFGGTNGSFPAAALIQGGDGNFYGTTTAGGVYGDGTVFRMGSNGAVTSLLSFAGANGSFPSAGLLQGSDGNLYGTTTSGGVGYDGLYWSGNGTVFRLAGAVASEAPLVVRQPASQIVAVGGTATFSVSAASSTPLSYVWQRNGENIAGASMASYTAGNVQLNDSGSVFSCLVSNAYGVVASSNATLTVVPTLLPPPPAPRPLSLPLAVLYSFDGMDGGHPSGAMVEGTDGSFYGTTEYGGSYQSGTVFRMTASGALTTLVSFDNVDGAYPSGALVEGGDGNFYGTTTGGGIYGDGTVFGVSGGGALVTWFSFNDSNGAVPSGALVEGADGNFYGTTTEGGSDGAGTIFSLRANGTVATLFSFNESNGGYPSGGLVEGADGNFYGTTEYGGTNDNGTIFRVTTNGDFTTLASFNYEVTGGYPSAGLTQGRDGSFYGTTEYGGTNGNGTVFRMGADGTLAGLFSFDNTDGAEPDGALVEGSDGNFYGTTEYGGTNDNGTIFVLSTNGTVASVFSFGSTNGLYPQGGLVEGADGSFYGTATYGGEGFNGASLSGDGIVFRLGADPPAPPSIVAQPASSIVPVSGAAIFKVNAGGTGPLSYTWQRNGNPIAGANQAAYTTNDVQLTDSGSVFSCVISNAYGSVTSLSAALTVFNGSGPLYSFGGPDGGYPSAGLVEGIDGNFYGTTTYGGTFGNGSLFRLTTNGLLGTLVSFSLVNGAQPGGALMEGGDGRLYGTTEGGGIYGNGTVFSLTTNGTLSTLVSFDGRDGEDPQGALVEGSDGHFYGMTADGGTNGDGTVFMMTADGTLSGLISFDGFNGAKPVGGLAQGTDGNLYGTTEEGGTNGYGTVFGLTTNGSLILLFSFSETNGAYPEGGLVEGVDGNFYGTTAEGGTNGEGTIFSLTSNGTVRSLFSFGGTNGSFPAAALIQGGDGNFYGTTTAGGLYGDGTVFRMGSNGTVTSLLSFAGANGSFPSAGLLQGSDGNLYGTTTSGGVGYDGLYWSGNGTVFRLAGAVASETPLVVRQPASQIVAVGGTATFSVSAASSTPLSYVWQRNGENIAGANLAGYTAGNVQLSDSGSVFSCLVSNAYGVVASSNATLTVVPTLPPPPPPPGPLSLPLAVLYSFDGVDGGHPSGAMVEGTDGSFYGTTEYGGSYQSGTVFRMTASGALTTLVSFDNVDGAYPSGALVEGGDGNFYGTTTGGGIYGDGTVFGVSGGGALVTWFSFNDSNGAVPSGALVEGADGNFYGTTTEGGSDGAGTIFSLRANGTVATLFSFNESNGGYPSGGLVEGADGNFYGTTEYGGTNDNGTIFRVTTNGDFTTLASFNYEVTGGYPSAGLTQGRDGSFYGTTEYGGTNGNGTVFRMGADGTLAGLFSFDNTDGAEPDGALVEGSDGNFYGTTEYGGTNDNGTIFVLSTNGTVASVFSFGSTNGLYPQGGLVEGADGSFYGTATYGGEGFNGASLSGDGIVFRLGADPPAPPSIVAQPASSIVPVSGAAIFKVNAGGTGPLSYTWQRNGNPIAGANQAAYTTNDVQLTDSGSVFSCVISNAYGSVTSLSAALTVFNGSGPLYSFGGPDGGYPSAGLVEGIDGNFYGTTTYGGTFGNGSLFRLTTNGLLGTLVSFSLVNGAQPGGALMEGGDGRLYGTTEGGGIYGNGTVFSLTTNGTLSTLVSFDGRDGEDPQGALVEGSDGHFYGMTADGGTNGDGTVFMMTADGTLSGLISFDGFNGAKPVGGLAQGTDGNLYGTTEEGGTNGYGTVFGLTTNGSLILLFSFSETNGAYPEGGLVEGVDGNFYGTTAEGGTNGEGTIFSLTSNGTVRSLFSFGRTNGSFPAAALIQGGDGNFYGTTTAGGLYGDGTVFRMGSNGTVTSLLSFAGANGSFPSAGLLQGSDGNLYGTTTSGGVGYDGLYWSGNGTVFRLAGAVASEAPLVVRQPASQIVAVGGTATFSVSAASSTPLSYAWQRNGENIAGANLAGYTAGNVQLSDSGSVFSCLVSNAYGVVASSNATLTVTLPSLVQNGGFELGSFANWTTSGNFEDCSVVSATPSVHSGVFGAEIGPIGSAGYISQTLATTVGEIYLVSCWIFCDGQTPNEFSVWWNGATLFDQQNMGDTAWTNLQFYAGATVTNTVLTFGFEDNPSYLGLDDLAVYPLGVAPPQLQTVTLSNGMITFSWSAVAGQRYQVQFTTNLAQPNWTNLGGPVSTTNSTLTISAPIGGESQQFYRSALRP